MKKIILATLVSLATALTANCQINFNPPLNLNLGSDTETVAIGDVNNDGLDDALIGTTFYFSEEFDYSIFVYLQQPDGTLPSVPIQYRYPESYSSKTIIQIADMNNDSRNDVIITFGDSLGIYYQTTNGTLGALKSWYSGNDADGLETGDLNNDGLEDIAVCHWNDPFIKVFYQQLSGELITETITYPNAGWDQLDVNDMNGDGLDDIIYMPGQMGGPAISIFFQNSNGGIQHTPVTYEISIDYWGTLNGFATGDLNNDGRNDLVGCIGGNSAWIAIMYQNETGTLAEPVYLNSYDIPTPAEIADLNCDGKNEIIIGHDAWSQFSVWEQDENGNFSDYNLYGSLYYVGPYALSTGDLNNDGRSDVLTTSGSSTNYVIYNTSAPEGTPFPDTIIRINVMNCDTTTSYNQTYNTSVTLKIGECLIQNNYQVEETSYYIFTDAEGDSLFPRHFYMCGNEIFDTIRKTFNIYEYQNGYLRDSTLLSTDTLVENIVITGFVSSNDTINITPETQTFIDLEIEHELTPQVLIITIDTLQITSQVLKIEYMINVVKHFTGTKCGESIIDSIVTSSLMTDYVILHSDTLLLGHTILVYPLGIDEQNDLKNITVFPNPAIDQFVIEIPDEYSNEGPFEIFINDITGHLIHKEKVINLSVPRIKVNTQEFKQGIYLVKIVGKTKMGSAKVIISR